MNTKVYGLYTKDRKLVKVIGPEGLTLPFTHVDNYKSYCGAGKGMGEKVIPDTIYGISVSPACYMHDIMWDDAEPTWADFHYSNSVFLTNLLALIDKQSSNELIKAIRNYRAMTYYNAVNTFGADIFWGIKGVTP